MCGAVLLRTAQPRLHWRVLSVIDIARVPTASHSDLERMIRRRLRPTKSFERVSYLNLSLSKRLRVPMGIRKPA